MKNRTAYDDGEPLSLQEWLFVWGVIGGFTAVGILVLVAFGYWLAGCQ